jgi:RNA recognition motif-containing protein
MELYIGNLPYTATATDVEKLIQTECNATCAFHVIMDRETQKSRGFGFAAFTVDEVAQRVLTHAQNTELALGGRLLVVNAAKGKAGKSQPHHAHGFRDDAPRSGNSKRGKQDYRPRASHRQYPD